MQIKVRRGAIKYWIMHSNVLLLVTLLLLLHLLTCGWFAIGRWVDDGWYNTQKRDMREAAAEPAVAAVDDDAVVYDYGFRGTDTLQEYLLSFYQVRRLREYARARLRRVFETVCVTSRLGEPSGVIGSN